MSDSWRGQGKCWASVVVQVAEQERVAAERHSMTLSLAANEERIRWGTGMSRV